MEGVVLIWIRGMIASGIRFIDILFEVLPGAIVRLSQADETNLSPSTICTVL